MDIKHLSEKEVKLLKEIMKEDNDEGGLPLKDILLSIKPKYIRKIKVGEKIWEFRKKIWSNNEIIDKIYLYETSPTQQIVGYFRTNQIINAKPKQLWDLCSDGSGIPKDQFFKYFKGHDEGYAIKISHLHFFENPIDPYKQLRGFHAPQNFMYISIESPKQKTNQKTLDAYLGVKLSKDLKQQIEQLAKKEDKTLSKLIRETLKNRLNAVKQDKPIKINQLNPPPSPSKKKGSEKSYKSSSVDSQSNKWGQLTKEFKDKVKEIKEKNKNKSKVKKPEEVDH